MTQIITKEILERMYKIPPKEVLERMYLDEGMTQKQIGSKFDVSRMTIGRQLRKYNILIKGRGVSKMPPKEVTETLAVPIPPKEVLERMYHDEGMTQREIANEFVVSQPTVCKWFNEYGIKVRTSVSSETRKKMSDAHSGENHYNWKGGITKDPYCEFFTEDVKEHIREKHGRRCFLCNKTEEENGTKLPVHHTDYNKDCGCDGTQCIFVPLCIGCNVKVNYNRSYWESLIKNKLKYFEMSRMMKHPLFDFAGTPEQPIKLFNLSNGKEVKPMKTPKYTKEGMIKYLKTLTQKLGHVPTTTDINKMSKDGSGPSRPTISKYITGNMYHFLEALEIAGLINKDGYYITSNIDNTKVN